MGRVFILAAYLLVLISVSAAADGSSSSSFFYASPPPPPTPYYYPSPAPPTPGGGMNYMYPPTTPSTPYSAPPSPCPPTTPSTPYSAPPSPCPPTTPSTPYSAPPPPCPPPVWVPPPSPVWVPPPSPVWVPPPSPMGPTTPTYYYASPPPPPYFPTYSPPPSDGYPCWFDGIMSQNDTDLVNSILRIQYLLGDFYLYSAFGNQLEKFSPKLNRNTIGGRAGPKTIGSRAFLKDDPLLSHMVAEFGILSITQISQTIDLLQDKAADRPQVNIGKAVFAKMMDSVFEQKMHPRFDPYANSTNFLIAAYSAGPSLGVSSCMNALIQLRSPKARSLVAGLLASFSSQDAVIRTMILEKKHHTVVPYKHTVEDFVKKISKMRKHFGSSNKESKAETKKHSISSDSWFGIGEGRMWSDVDKIVTDLELLQSREP